MSASQDTEEQALFAYLYWDMLRVARGLMTAERKGHSLQATAIVHEAYLRLADSTGLRYTGDRKSLLALAIRVMQQVLIEHARGKHAQKRGHGWQRVDLAIAEESDQHEGSDHLQRLREAVERLESLDARKGQLVRLRYDYGMTLTEAAQQLGISPSTAAKDWAFARSWLRVELEELSE